jgi:glutamine amidotransferase
MRIGVLDYGAGNLRSVYRAINHLGHEYVEVRSSSEFDCLDKLIIPGVGAFQVAMNQLRDKNLIAPVNDFSKDGMPILGVCLGMQLLFNRSAEFGDSNGLGLIEGSLLHIRDQFQLDHQRRIKVPHIGWSTLECSQSDMIFDSLDNTALQCYFIHSFMACNVPDENIIALADYHGLKIPAVVKVRNTYGLQFHPEKSGEKGLQMLRNFLGIQF